MKNGYFKLVLSDTESYVTLYPPVDGGASIPVDELRDYLIAKGFPDVDIVSLKNAIESLDKPKNVKIANKKGIPCPESFTVMLLPICTMKRMPEYSETSNSLAESITGHFIVKYPEVPPLP